MLSNTIWILIFSSLAHAMDSTIFTFRQRSLYFVDRNGTYNKLGPTVLLHELGLSLDAPKSRVLMMRDVTMAERIDGRPVCRVLIKPTACTVLAALSTINVMISKFDGPDPYGLEFFGPSTIKDMDGFTVGVIVPLGTEEKFVAHINAFTDNMEDEDKELYVAAYEPVTLKMNPMPPAWKLRLISYKGIVHNLTPFPLDAVCDAFELLLKGRCFSFDGMSATAVVTEDVDPRSWPKMTFKYPAQSVLTLYTHTMLRTKRDGSIYGIDLNYHTDKVYQITSTNVTDEELSVQVTLFPTITLEQYKILKHSLFNLLAYDQYNANIEFFRPPVLPYAYHLKFKQNSPGIPFETGPTSTYQMLQAASQFPASLDQQNIYIEFPDCKPSGNKPNFAYHVTLPFDSFLKKYMFINIFDVLLKKSSPILKYHLFRIVIRNLPDENAVQMIWIFQVDKATRERMEQLDRMIPAALFHFVSLLGVREIVVNGGLINGFSLKFDRKQDLDITFYHIDDQITLGAPKCTNFPFKIPATTKPLTTTIKQTKPKRVVMGIVNFMTPGIFITPNTEQVLDESPAVDESEAMRQAFQQGFTEMITTLNQAHPSSAMEIPEPDTPEYTQLLESSLKNLADFNFMDIITEALAESGMSREDLDALQAENLITPQPLFKEREHVTSKKALWKKMTENCKPVQEGTPVKPANQKSTQAQLNPAFSISSTASVSVEDQSLFQKAIPASDPEILHPLPMPEPEILESAQKLSSDIEKEIPGAAAFEEINKPALDMKATADTQSEVIKVDPLLISTRQWSASLDNLKWIPLTTEGQLLYFIEKYASTGPISMRADQEISHRPEKTLTIQISPSSVTDLMKLVKFIMEHTDFTIDQITCNSLTECFLFSDATSISPKSILIFRKALTAYAPVKRVFIEKRENL